MGLVVDLHIPMKIRTDLEALGAGAIMNCYS